MDTLHQRLLKSFDYLRDMGVVHTQVQFSEAIGKPRPGVTKAFNGNERYCTLGLMKAIYKAYGEYINEQYLIEGTGELAKLDSKAFKPFVDVPVAAGFTGVSVGTALKDECEQRPIIPSLPSYDYTIRVKGDSMLPLLMDGDILACRWIERNQPLQDSKTYVLDTDDGAVVKRVRLDGRELVCSSLNPAYETYSIPIDAVQRIAIVVGMVREM